MDFAIVVVVSWEVKVHHRIFDSDDIALDQTFFGSRHSRIPSSYLKLVLDFKIVRGSIRFHLGICYKYIDQNMGLMQCFAELSPETGA